MYLIALTALATAEESGDAWLQQRVQELQEKRDLAYQMVLEIPQVSCPKPMGAFYLLPDISAYLGKTLVATDTAADDASRPGRSPGARRRAADAGGR